jgi:magnesium-transporting ATPase (P-type)
MCKEVGFAHMIERDQKTIKIMINGNTEVYEIIKVEEFTSDRKRMSVVVKRNDG